jgi:hypothetical protein
MQVDLLFRKIPIAEVSASTPPIITRMIRLKMHCTTIIPVFGP